MIFEKVTRKVGQADSNISTADFLDHLARDLKRLLKAKQLWKKLEILSDRSYIL